MTDKISILLRIVPKYGEILFGVGSVLLSYQESILDNVMAKESIKQFLLNDAPKSMDVLGVSRSVEFNKIIYKYTGQKVNIFACKDTEKAQKLVNLLLVDLFQKSIWPILVNRYIDTIYSGVDKVIIGINIKKSAYLKIYSEDDSSTFFNEFKDFLLYNHIFICESTIKGNGDILVKLVLPVLPNMRFGF